MTYPFAQKTFINNLAEEKLEIYKRIEVIE